MASIGQKNSELRQVYHTSCESKVIRDDGKKSHTEVSQENCDQRVRAASLGAFKPSSPSSSSAKTAERLDSSDACKEAIYQEGYPGNPEKYTSKDRWETLFEKSDITSLLRGMKFITNTPNPLFDVIYFYGFVDSSIAIHIRSVIDNYSNVLKYLKSSGFVIDNEKPLNFNGNFLLIFKEHSDLKKIFEILTQNNEFPDEDLRLMRDLVQAGNWKDVTPLTQDQESWLAQKKAEESSRYVDSDSD